MPLLLYWGQRLLSPLFLLYQKTPPLGAYTTVHAATCPGLRGVGGRYFVNSQATEDFNPLARDLAVGERLWAASEAAVGLVEEEDSPGAVGGVGAGKKGGGGGSARTPPRRRRKSLGGDGDGGGDGRKKGGANGGDGGGNRATTPQRRRSLRRTPSKGKLALGSF